MTYKYHVVYKTTNKINGKIYIGFHSTDNIQDSYLGSGKALKTAIAKYGKEFFIKEILQTFETRDLARKFESELVTTEFVNRKDTYNLTEGGTGVDSQFGIANHRFGKPAFNRKEVIAKHLDGTLICANSIQELSNKIGIDRANIRNLIKKKITGRLGWRVYLV